MQIYSSLYFCIQLPGRLQGSMCVYSIGPPASLNKFNNTLFTYVNPKYKGCNAGALQEQKRKAN